MAIDDTCKRVCSSLRHNLQLARSDAEKEKFALLALEAVGNLVLPELVVLRERETEEREYARARVVVLDTISYICVTYMPLCSNFGSGVITIDGLVGKTADEEVRQKLSFYANQLKKRWNVAEPGGVLHNPRAKKFHRPEPSNAASSVVLVVFVIVAVAVLLRTDLTSLIFTQLRQDVASIDSKRRELPVVPVNEEPRPTAPATSVPEVREAVPPVEGHSANFFRYVDDSGTLHIVNDPALVPERYRKKAEVTAAGVSPPSTTPVSTAMYRVLVPVTLSYRGRTVRATLLLDTGANVTVISERLAAQLGVDIAATKPGVSTIADGSQVRSWRFVADAVTVGPKTVRPIEVSILPGAGTSNDGLLGMNFLGRFSYSIDMNRGVIQWR